MAAVFCRISILNSFLMEYDAIRLGRHQIDSLPDAVVYPDTTE